MRVLLTLAELGDNWKALMESHTRARMLIQAAGIPIVTSIHSAKVYQLGQFSSIKI